MLCHSYLKTVSRMVVAGNVTKVLRESRAKKRGEVGHNEAAATSLKELLSEGEVMTYAAVVVNQQLQAQVNMR